jgi:LuxR family maltose regulon positive regulatory protein
MAGDHDMGQILDAHAPRSRFGSPSQFMVAGEQDATVFPLVSEEPGKPVGPSVAIGDSPSVTAVRGWLVQSLLVEAILRHEAGQAAAAEHGLERALELASCDRVLLPFLVDPVPELLQRHAYRNTAHADLIHEIVELRVALEGATPREGSEPLAEPLTESETRILRLLATYLSNREIAGELYVSLNTVKTHVKHLYAKLDVRTRRHAVERARSLGLLTYSSRKPVRLPIPHSG